MELNATILQHPKRKNTVGATARHIPNPDTQTDLIRQIYIDESAQQRNEQTDAFLLRHQDTKPVNSSS